MNGRFVPLFWRLFVPNATVLTVACVVLIVEPAHGQVVALVGGLIALLGCNLVLMRRTVAPVARLRTVMQRIDPLLPGQRIAIPSPVSEVTLLAGSFNEMLDRLEAERRDSARRALSAEEAERRRLAAELHDEVGQNLTALALHLDRIAAGESGDPRAEAADARESVLGVVDDLRGLVRRLRPEALDVLGLPAALTGLVDRLSEQTGLRIDHDVAPELPPLADDAQLVIYRVAQESLTNVVRHAGASLATLSLRSEGGDVVLRVVDDGVGLSRRDPQRSDPAAAVAEQGGIRFMRERAVVIGGALTLDPGRAGGTAVTLRVAREQVTSSPPGS